MAHVSVDLLVGRIFDRDRALEADSRSMAGGQRAGLLSADEVEAKVRSVKIRDKNSHYAQVEPLPGSPVRGGLVALSFTVNGTPVAQMLSAEAYQLTLRFQSLIWKAGGGQSLTLLGYMRQR